jgi:hypothetical protein
MSNKIEKVHPTFFIKNSHFLSKWLIADIQFI